MLGFPYFILRACQLSGFYCRYILVANVNGIWVYLHGLYHDSRYSLVVNLNDIVRYLNGLYYYSKDKVKGISYVSTLNHPSVDIDGSLVYLNGQILMIKSTMLVKLCRYLYFCRVVIRG